MKECEKVVNHECGNATEEDDAMGVGVQEEVRPRPRDWDEVDGDETWGVDCRDKAMTAKGPKTTTMRVAFQCFDYRDIWKSPRGNARPINYTHSI